MHGLSIGQRHDIGNIAEAAQSGHPDARLPQVNDRFYESHYP